MVGVMYSAGLWLVSGFASIGFGVPKPVACASFLPRIIAALEEPSMLRSTSRRNCASSMIQVEPHCDTLSIPRKSGSTNK